MKHGIPVYDTGKSNSAQGMTLTPILVGSSVVFTQQALVEGVREAGHKKTAAGLQVMTSGMGLAMALMSDNPHAQQAGTAMVYGQATRAGIGAGRKFVAPLIEGLFGGGKVSDVSSQDYARASQPAASQIQSGAQLNIQDNNASQEQLQEAEATQTVKVEQAA